MDIFETFCKDKPVKATELSDWMLARGISCITTGQASCILGVPANQVRQRLSPLRKRGRIASPSRGYWVAVPPEYSTWGAPEPAVYLDSLMGLMDTEYYVGWLTAAALHGASHQAPQVFQVAVGRRLEDRTVGRSRIHFLTRSDISLVPTKRLALSSGMLVVSTPGATMLDVMEDLGEASGLDNAITVVVELAQENDDAVQQAAECAHLYSDSAVRRLGWALETFGGIGSLGALEIAAQGSAKNPSLLSPYDRRNSVVNEKWRLNINREVDPDL